MKTFQKLVFVFGVMLSVFLITGMHTSQAKKPTNCGQQTYDCPPGYTGEIIRCVEWSSGPWCLCGAPSLSNCTPE